MLDVPSAACVLRSQTALQPVRRVGLHVHRPASARTQAGTTQLGRKREIVADVGRSAHSPQHLSVASTAPSQAASRLSGCGPDGFAALLFWVVELTLIRRCGRRSRGSGRDERWPHRAEACSGWWEDGLWRRRNGSAARYPGGAAISASGVHRSRPANGPHVGEARGNGTQHAEASHHQYAGNLHHLLASIGVLTRAYRTHF